MLSWLKRLFQDPPKSLLESERKLTTDIYGWCRSNWSRVPEDQRRVCVDHLRSVVPEEAITLWKGQLSRGEEIGSNVMGWHFAGGMAVRNTLRDVMPDSMLPPVIGPDGGYLPGEKVRNWDDFYTGALEELCETTQ